MERGIEAIKYPAKRVIPFVLMFSTLFLYTNCIVSFELLLQENRSDLHKTKMKITLKDNFVLFLNSKN